MPRTLSTPQHEALLDMLLEARERQGVTQETLAQAIGFRQADISKTERGVRRLDVLELRQWVTALGLDFVEFAQLLHERLGGLEALHRMPTAGIRTASPKPRAK